MGTIVNRVETAGDIAERLIKADALITQNSKPKTFSGHPPTYVLPPVRLGVSRPPSSSLRPAAGRDFCASGDFHDLPD